MVGKKDFLGKGWMAADVRDLSPGRVSPGRGYCFLNVLISGSVSQE